MKHKEFDERRERLFRGYEELDEQGRGQLKSLTEWLNEEAKKRKESGHA